MIWTCARGDKHENVVRATFDLVAELSLTLHPNYLEMIFMKVSSIPDTEFDEKTVLFLKQQTLNAISNLRRRAEIDLQNQKSQMSYMNQMRGKQPHQVAVDESKYIDILKFWVLF